MYGISYDENLSNYIMSLAIFARLRSLLSSTHCSCCSIIIMCTYYSSRLWNKFDSSIHCVATFNYSSRLLRRYQSNANANANGTMSPIFGKLLCCCCCCDLFRIDGVYGVTRTHSIFFTGGWCKILALKLSPTNRWYGVMRHDYMTERLGLADILISRL